MNKINSIQKQTILIVDDVPKNIQLVANFLTKEGYEINFAVDGKSALEHAMKGPYDLILLDVMMPGTDGFEVCEQLKNNELTKDIPVIFLTAKIDIESITKGFEIGGVDYITKPFAPKELLARVKTHLKLRSREKELKELNNTKNTILSIIGHDLKTPFANIISLGGLLTGQVDITEHERTEIIKDLIDSGNQGVWLLENLLSWTRIQSGSININNEVLDIGEIIRQNVEFVFQNAQYKGVSVTEEVQDGLKIYSDVNIVNTILRNLLSNGIKFTHTGGEVKIISGLQAENIVSVRVQDNGVGMEAEKLDELFSNIGTTSTDGTNNEKGSGLGLVLVKELTELLGARIAVESNVGMGTTFTLSFKEYKG